MLKRLLSRYRSEAGVSFIHLSAFLLVGVTIIAIGYSALGPQMPEERYINVNFVNSNLPVAEAVQGGVQILEVGELAATLGKLAGQLTMVAGHEICNFVARVDESGASRIIVAYGLSVGAAVDDPGQVFECDANQITDDLVETIERMPVNDLNPWVHAAYPLDPGHSRSTPSVSKRAVVARASRVSEMPEVVEYDPLPPPPPPEEEVPEEEVTEEVPPVLRFEDEDDDSNLIDEVPDNNPCFDAAFFEANQEFCRDQAGRNNNQDLFNEEGDPCDDLGFAWMNRNLCAHRFGPDGQRGDGHFDDGQFGPPQGGPPGRRPPGAVVPNPPNGDGNNDDGRDDDDDGGHRMDHPHDHRPGPGDHDVGRHDGHHDHHDHGPMPDRDAAGHVGGDDFNLHIPDFHFGDSNQNDDSIVAGSRHDLGDQDLMNHAPHLLLNGDLDFKIEPGLGGNAIPQDEPAGDVFGHRAPDNFMDRVGGSQGLNEQLVNANSLTADFGDQPMEMYNGNK